MVTRIERAYLAGVIDGEGSIFGGSRVGVKGNRRGFELRVNICNTDPRLIDWVAERWEGRRSIVDRSKYRQKDLHRWDADGTRVVTVLRDALPYLVIKKTQAEIALELAASKRNPGRAGYTDDEHARFTELLGQLQRLNLRGTRPRGARRSGAGDEAQGASS